MSFAGARRIPQVLGLGVLVIGLTGAAAPQYTRDEATAVFRVANEAAARDDLNTAIDGYERLAGSGYGNADVEYNLGTAYLKEGRVGPAILHLERALRLAPLDSEARANLDRAQRLRVDKLVGAPEEAAGDEPFLDRVVSRTGGNPFSIAFAISYFACAAGLLLRRFLGAGGLRALVSGLAVIGFVGALPTGAVVAAHAYVHQGMREAIVMASAAQVKEGPSGEARTSFEVHEGLKVRVLGEDGSFLRVRLANGLEGWTDRNGISPI